MNQEPLSAQGPVDREVMGNDVRGAEMTHIDDWIDSPHCKDDGERYAKFVFWYFRYPAWAKMAFHEWMKDHKLFCTYEGERFRCTGASRMGDVWLARNFERETGYDLRVDVAKCEQWGQTPNASFSRGPSGPSAGSDS